MRIGLIASPFISVPPPAYGGTELFIANLAEGLMRLGADVCVYTNGESSVKAEVRWVFPRHQWPLSSELAGVTRELDHSSWAIADAERNCDVIHVNSALALPFSRLTTKPVVCTMHHPFEHELAELYKRHGHVAYVAISSHQALQHKAIAPRVIQHGVDLSQYRFSDKKRPYVCFLGRICPVKGAHNAIEIAKRAGIPLKIAGEVQPIFREYFDSKIRPHVDGRNVEFVGPADLAMKNELLGNAAAMLFPIEWQEPFGLAMIEAMACGTPVIAFPGGSVEELVDNGITGKVCSTVDEAANCLKEDVFHPRMVRAWAEKRFSSDGMARQYHSLYGDLVEETTLPADFDTEEAAA
jgi:glycosyltransferase involved in cell wall biosynthesis